MRWLCNIRADLPGEWTQAKRDDMVNRENEHAAALMQRGVLRRIFRIVGQTATDRFRVAGRVFLEEELEPADSPESVARPSAGP